MIISKDLFLLGDQDYLRLPNKDEKRTTMIRPVVKSQRYVTFSIYNRIIVNQVKNNSLLVWYFLSIPNLESCFKQPAYMIPNCSLRYYFFKQLDNYSVFFCITCKSISPLFLLLINSCLYLPYLNLKECVCLL